MNEGGTFMENEKLNTVINRVIIESNKGDRSFTLVEGDLLQDDGDLIVVNTYENEHGEIEGDFAQVLKEQFHLGESQERPVFYLENGGYISFIESVDKEAKKMLILHSKLKEGEPISQQLYETMIKGLFSSLVSLEISGFAFTTVSFPVLLRKGINGVYNEAASTLIQQAVKWLKKSSCTNTIRYYVYLENDSTLWHEAIERSLGRSVVNANIDEDISRLRTYLLGLIYSFPKEEAVYHDTLVPLQNALNRDSISPEVVAAFGRKLAESLCESITGNTDVTFNINLSTIKNKENIDPFFIQCLYQIKAYGNTSIHRSKSIYGSDSLTSEDLKILLLILKKILLEYQKKIMQNRITS